MHGVGEDEEKCIYDSLYSVAGIVCMAIGTMRRSLIVRAQSKPESSVVKIDNFSFGPGTLTVPIGTAVTWTNRDDIRHTAVSTDASSSPK
jgi:plastocyanin